MTIEGEDLWPGVGMTGGKLSLKLKDIFARKRYDSGGAETPAELQRKEHGIMLKLQRLPRHERCHMVKLFRSYTVNGSTGYAQHYLVMYPAARDGNLKRFLLKTARGKTSLLKMMGCLVTGLAILHKANIRHHDLHPGNILVHNDKPYYTDFGLAYNFENSKDSKTKSDRRHHPQFAAPEFLTNQVRDTKSDVFGPGGILYEIAAVLKGDQAMLDHRPKMSNTQFGDKEESRDARSALDEAIKSENNLLMRFWLETISSMLNLDPEKRPFARELALDSYQQDPALACESCQKWYQMQRN